MHVEVNETNIAMYELVELTGNSREDLLKAAEEAQESGYTLYCQIPDNKIEVNAFEHFNSEPAPKARHNEEEFEVVTEDNTVVRVDFGGVEVVEGEVIDEQDD